MRAQYLDSIEDMDIINCHLFCQLIGSPSNVNIYVPIDICVFEHKH